MYEKMEISMKRTPKSNPKEILALKRQKNSLEGFKDRFELAEEKISLKIVQWK